MLGEAKVYSHRLEEKTEVKMGHESVAVYVSVAPAVPCGSARQIFLCALHLSSSPWPNSVTSPCLVREVLSMTPPIKSLGVSDSPKPSRATRGDRDELSERTPFNAQYKSARADSRWIDLDARLRRFESHSGGATSCPILEMLLHHAFRQDRNHSD